MKRQKWSEIKASHEARNARRIEAEARRLSDDLQLSQLREAPGLTQEAMGELFGVTQADVSKIEHLWRASSPSRALRSRTLTSALVEGVSACRRLQKQRLNFISARSRRQMAMVFRALPKHGPKAKRLTRFACADSPSIVSARIPNSERRVLKALRAKGSRRARRCTHRLEYAPRASATSSAVRSRSLDSSVAGD